MPFSRMEAITSQQYDVPVPRGKLARTPQEVADAVKEFGMSFTHSIVDGTLMPLQVVNASSNPRSSKEAVAKARSTAG